MECQKGHDFPIKEPLERNRYQWKDSFDQWKDPERTIKMHGLKCSYLQVTFVCISYKSRSCIAIFACEEIYVLYLQSLEER